MKRRSSPNFHGQSCLILCKIFCRISQSEIQIWNGLFREILFRNTNKVGDIFWNENPLTKGVFDSFQLTLHRYRSQLRKVVPCSRYISLNYQAKAKLLWRCRIVGWYLTRQAFNSKESIFPQDQLQLHPNSIGHLFREDMFSARANSPLPN